VLTNLPTLSAAALPAGQVKHSSKHTKVFYNGKIKTHINLNDKGSSKETWHIEISSDEGVYYLPGDSLGIVPS
jgi:sulfite reductase (NADPH) flavoprotein alpha-component